MKKKLEAEKNKKGKKVEEIKEDGSNSSSSGSEIDLTDVDYSDTESESHHSNDTRSVFAKNKLSNSRHQIYFHLNTL